MIGTVVARGAVASDSWYTVLGGRIVTRSGLPHSDTLTVMSLGHRWVDQQWLAQLGLYGLWSAGGWRLGGFATVVLFIAAFAISAACARRLGASDRSVAIVAGAAFFTGLPNTAIRAQIAAYPLFAVVLALLLADARRQSRRIWLVFPLLILWANLHGSVLVGAALVALRGMTLAYAALRSRTQARGSLTRAATLVLVPWLCVLVSPYGLGLPGYYGKFVSNPTLAHAIPEWGASTLRSDPLFFVLLLAGLWLVARSRAALTPFAQAAFWACALLGLVAVRNEVWYALAAAAVLPAALDAAWRPRGAQRRSGLNLALAVAGLVAGTIALASLLTHGRTWWERGYPGGAAAAVASAARSNHSLKVFADERYADWLLVSDPALAGRVAYDVRYELLSTPGLRSVIAFRRESGLAWQRAADGYGLLVLDPVGDRGAVRLFEGEPGTKVLYRSPDVIVLRRGV